MIRTLLAGILTLAIPVMANAANQNIKIKVTVAGKTLTATLIDNATSRALLAKLPLTLPMQDLYSREMCYHFAEALPANETRTSGYQVGDIVYWPPRHSLVIMYRQNGEQISSLQKIGRVDSGVEIFSHTGDAQVTFERIEIN